MKSGIRKIGVAVIVFGTVVLLAGIVMGLTVGTYLVAVCLSSSILINSVGIMMLRSNEKPPKRRQR